MLSAFEKRMALGNIAQAFSDGVDARSYRDAISVQERPTRGKPMRTIFAAIAFAATSTAALAENTYASDGVITAQSSAVVTLLSEGHMLMSLPSTHNAFAMSVAGHPFSEMTGTCNGTAEVIGAAVNGGGHCLYENTSGEMLVVRWTAKHIDGNGAFHGDWVVTGGTGSLSGATGGGGFVSLTDDTGAQEVSMTGALSL